MTTRDFVLIALFTALVVALGMVPGIPIAAIPVPVVLQNLGIMMAGALLGARRGALVALLLVVLVAVGLPVLSGGRGGLGVLMGPTGGFVIGWVFGAFVTGLVVDALAPSRSGLVRTVGAVLLGVALGNILVVYTLGVLWLSLSTGTPLLTAAAGMGIFVPIDLAKGVIAGLATHAVSTAYPIRRAA